MMNKTSLWFLLPFSLVFITEPIPWNAGKFLLRVDSVSSPFTFIAKVSLKSFNRRIKKAQLIIIVF